MSPRAETLNLDDALQTFIVESRELLDDMEFALLNIRTAADPSNNVNSIFRAAHTIKGSAGLFGLDAVVAFTHVVESLLDEVRAGAVRVDNERLIELLLACKDHMGALINGVASGVNVKDGELPQAGSALIKRLQEHLATYAPQSELAAGTNDSENNCHPGSKAPCSGPQLWHISLRFGPNVLRNGMDPLSFLRYMETFGTIGKLVTLPDAVPALDEMDPESCYLGMEVPFRTVADKKTIESVFEFVLDDCDVRILPPNCLASEFIDLIEQLPEEHARLGEILVRCGSVTANELETALHTQQALKSTPGAHIGEILVDSGVIQPQVVQAALAKQKQVKEIKAQENRSIRVDAEKLDQLINLVGELIIASAGAKMLARLSMNSDLLERNSTLSDLVEQVRDSALQLRMVKIGATFSRFERVVHDVSRDIGKNIGLVVSGEDTELDKTVVEKIADPLTHLVRNAMDHGIESAEVRAANRKPARGTVKLNAYHDSGSIVIEVSDDGGGLNRDKILAKAVERGLVEAGKSLSDGEIYALIFEPGFSTADQVTNLSGRGVGMDVVKSNITALRGTVAIESQPGVGTTVRVRLPLTLAIINGFQIGVGESVFVVPLDMVDECVACSSEPGHDYIDLRGRVLPFIRLRDFFDLPGSAGARENIVVVKHAGQKIGLVVDTLLGEAQTVIKPLSKMFCHVKGISGSSILGSGDVALILDIPVLLQHTSVHAPDRAKLAA